MCIHSELAKSGLNHCPSFHHLVHQQTNWVSGLKKEIKDTYLLLNTQCNRYAFYVKNSYSKT